MQSFEQPAASGEEGVAPERHVPGPLGFWLCGTSVLLACLGHGLGGLAHLTSPLQSCGKVLHRGEARFGVLGQGAQHHLLHLEGDRCHILMQWRRRHDQLLHHDLGRRALKRAAATQPFVDHHP